MKNWFLAVGILLAVSCAVLAGETIKLPVPKSQGAMSVEESVYRRRSERSFLPNQITRADISQLLWSCQGITDPDFNFRAAPSAGALYPLEVYVVNEEGVYHYIPLEHKLVQILKGDRRPNLARAALAQTFISDAPVNIVISAAYNRTRVKFGSRAERYVNMEAGMAAENLLLQAAALGFASIVVGSFWDDVVASSLNLPPEHEPLLIIPIGYPKK